MEEDARVSKEEAKDMILVENGRVHTFLNNPNFGLIGADWQESSVIEAIDESYICKKTGPEAQKIGHGLAIIPSEECYQSDIIFVKTKK